MNLPGPKCVQCGESHCGRGSEKHGPAVKEPVNVKDAMKGVLGIVQITKGKKGKPATVKHFKVTKIKAGTGPGPALKPGTGPGAKYSNEGTVTASGEIGGGDVRLSPEQKAAIVKAVQNPLDYKPMMGREGGAD